MAVLPLLLIGLAGLVEFGTKVHGGGVTETVFRSIFLGLPVKSPKPRLGANQYRPYILENTVYRIGLRKISPIYAVHSHRRPETQPHSGNRLNKLTAKLGLPFDPLHLTGSFDLPRTIKAAEKDKWAEAHGVLTGRGVSVWCRDNDYRVCLLFDSLGSVAGIQVSHSVEDLKATEVPQDFAELPDWTRQTVLGVDVYSAIAYFEDPSKLQRGEGRILDADTNTAEGIWVEQSIGPPQRIPFTEKELEDTTDFTRQGCFFGQGQHYFRNLTKTSDCKDSGPYYMLYEPKTKTMLGFGVIIFGKTSQRSFPHRKWFINPPSVVARIVAPNGPDCTKEWMHKYGSTSLHVFFRPHPWLIRC